MEVAAHFGAVAAEMTALFPVQMEFTGAKRFRFCKKGMSVWRTNGF